MTLAVLVIMRMIMIVGVIVVMVMLGFNNADVRLAVDLDVEAGTRVRFIRATAYDHRQRLADQLEVRCLSFGIFRLPRGRKHVFSWLAVDRNVDLHRLGRDRRRGLRIAIQYIDTDALLIIIVRELRVVRGCAKFNDMAIVRARLSMSMLVVFVFR